MTVFQNNNEYYIQLLCPSRLCFRLYVRLSKMAIDFTLRDVGMVRLIAHAVATKDMLIRHGIIPANIMK